MSILYNLIFNHVKDNRRYKSHQNKINVPFIHYINLCI